MPNPKIAIIGAGLSGVSAANALSGKADVTLFEKSRGVGGRMSTRYAGDYEFDHGAQYFTVTDPAFQAVIDRAVKDGVVAPWKSRGFYLKSGKLLPDTGRPRFVGTPRMNSLPKYLADGLDIKLGARVADITKGQDRWRLDFEDGNAASGFDAVICTIPPQQAQQLLPPKFAHMNAVKAAKLDACFALMIGLDSAVDLGWDTLRVSDLPVAWMAMNHTKPGRDDGVSTLIIHANAGWSERHQDADRDWVQNTLIGTAESLTNLPLKTAPHIALHRWLYANMGQGPNVPCLADPKIKLIACGDWCSGGRVEGAWLSGKAAADAALSMI